MLGIKHTTCYNCGRQVIYGVETVYSEIGVLICLDCFEVEAEGKGIIMEDGKIVSHHHAPSVQQEACLNCTSCCCQQIGCSLVHPEKGCLIYDKRPEACREFFCRALSGVL